MRPLTGPAGAPAERRAAGDVAARGPGAAAGAPAPPATAASLGFGWRVSRWRSTRSPSRPASSASASLIISAVAHASTCSVGASLCTRGFASLTCCTCPGRTKRPWRGAHAKYWIPSTLPSFRPQAVVNSTPTHSPSAKLVGPTKRIVHKHWRTETWAPTSRLAESKAVAAIARRCFRRGGKSCAARRRSESSKLSDCARGP